MATSNTAVKIEDGQRLAFSDGEFRAARIDTSGLAGGVFNTRSRSRAGSYRSARAELGYNDEEGDERQDGNQKAEAGVQRPQILLSVSPWRMRVGW